MYWKPVGMPHRKFACSKTLRPSLKPSSARSESWKRLPHAWTNQTRRSSSTPSLASWQGVLQLWLTSVGRFGLRPQLSFADHTAMTPREFLARLDSLERAINAAEDKVQRRMLARDRD